MSSQQLVCAPHRRLAWLVIEAKHVYEQFPAELSQQEWLKMKLHERDNLVMARTHSVASLSAALDKVPQAAHAQTFRTGCMDGKAKEMFAPDKDKLIGQIVEEGQEVLRQLRETQTLQSTQSPSVKKQYFGHGFYSMAVMSVPVGRLAPTGGPESTPDKTPIIYASLDSNGTVHFTASNKQNVKLTNVLFSQQAINLGWEKEIKYRRTAATVLAKAHVLAPPPASFPEIKVALEDQRHVPLLLMQLSRLGHLGKVNTTFVKEAQAEHDRLWARWTPKLNKFFAVIRGDERAFPSLLVRAAATLHSLAQLDATLTEILDFPGLDRWLWLTMREVVDLSTERPTFLLKDRAGWEEWVGGVTPWEVRADRDCKHVDVFQQSDLAGLRELCPIAANRPVELAMPAREVLGRGILACNFAPQASSGDIYRALTPTWTIHYQRAMEEMFGGREIPPIPTQPHIPQAPEQLVGSAPELVVCAVYNAVIHRYSDGRPEGSTYIVIQWFKELYQAFKSRDNDRFRELIRLHKRWEADGTLVVNEETTGLQGPDLDQRRFEYHAGLGEDVTNPSDYRWDRSEKRRRMDDKKMALSGKAPAKREKNVLYTDGQGNVHDKSGKHYEQQPVDEGDLDDFTRQG
ncbi:hypothetical protein N0V83_010833 [Neocucurbitaria cava]|uniref:Uncharacterized protein n=1 Tax=Neocucurbitaria cava TaxID=798079 RepID=A0A9W8XWZ6_9PLEO|nr:hypothetical protein N0V83_010833 [Neocucurbitaria cava]